MDPDIRPVPRPARTGARLRRVPRSTAFAGLALAAFMIFLSAWAVASPIGASPDEDYHLASIWCAQGKRDGVCEVSPDGNLRSIPTALTQANCFAFESGESAACQTGEFVSNGEDLTATDRGNFGRYAGDYPPVFYQTMSLFVGPDAERSVIVMRLFNAAILTAMLAVTYAASSSRVRRALVLTVGVTIIPLGAFVVPSINPSSWATISGMTLFFAVAGYLAARTRRQIATLGGIASVALALGAGARADASMYAIIAIGAAVLIWWPAGRPTRAPLLRLVLPAVLAMIAAGSFLTAGQTAAAGQSSAHGPMTFASQFIEVFTYWPGAFGMAPLGWVDTPMPSIVWVPVTACFFAVMFVAVATAARRRAIVLGLVAFSAAMIPTYVASMSDDPVGSVQARYVYPLLIVVMAVATLSTERRPFVLTQLQRWLVVGATSVAAGVAIYRNLRRYVTGIEIGGLRLEPGEWWWSAVPISSEVVCVLGTVGFFVAFALASRILVSTDEDLLGSDLGEIDNLNARAVAPPHLARHSS